MLLPPLPVLPPQEALKRLRIALCAVYNPTQNRFIFTVVVVSIDAGFHIIFTNLLRRLNVDTVR
jgi:hypothetical protein